MFPKFARYYSHKIRKNEFKINHVKDVEAFILHSDNNAKKLLTNWRLNNHVIHSCFPFLMNLLGF